MPHIGVLSSSGSRLPVEAVNAPGSTFLGSTSDTCFPAEALFIGGHSVSGYLFQAHPGSVVLVSFCSSKSAVIFLYPKSAIVLDPLVFPTQTAGYVV